MSTQSQIPQPKISERDLTYLETILKEWYCNNSDSLFTKKNSNIMKYMKNIAEELNSFNKFNPPEFLYRGISFEDSKTKEQMVKTMKDSGILKHPTKDYDSWTSSLDIAEEYVFGDKASHQGGANLILKVPYQCIEDSLLFTSEYLFTGEDTTESRRIKQQFFRKILNNKLNGLVQDIKTKKYQKNQWDTTIKDMEKLIPGLSRALTEFEYILKPIKSDSIVILMQTKGK